jgi:hypothetical protein
MDASDFNRGGVDEAGTLNPYLSILSNILERVLQSIPDLFAISVFVYSYSIFSIKKSIALIKGVSPKKIH